MGKIDERSHAACGGTRHVFQFAGLGIGVVREADVVDWGGEAVYRGERAVSIVGPVKGLAQRTLGRCISLIPYCNGAISRSARQQVC